jgi:tetratricopeptide (TPR) repeat protein
MVTSKHVEQSGAHRWSARFFVLGLTACLLIAGCAAPNSELGSSEGAVESLVKQANEELVKGQRDQAITLLNRAAQKNPASTVPWLKIASIWFDAGNYPSSILAANEVLQRDATNQEAKSLLVVAGLRVAAGAVSGLRSTNKVNSSARAEAETLTKSLRNALGEEILVPAPNAESKQTPNSAKSKLRARAKALPPAATKGRPASSGATDVGGDPFKSLK